MLKIEHVQVGGIEPAIRGMRNPKNSWDLSDSFEDHVCDIDGNCGEYFNVGPVDKDLMMRLAKGGSVHAKFRRMLVVWMDITAPLYWWKEFDTYKVGTVANSCSTMHKIDDKVFEYSDFSTEHLSESYFEYDILEEGFTSSAFLFQQTIDLLNHYRKLFVLTKKRLKDNEYKDTQLRLRDQKHLKEFWWQMIQLLPTSYNQKRTVMLSYEVLASMQRDRKGHKLDEWKTLLDFIDTLEHDDIIKVAKEYN